MYIVLTKFTDLVTGVKYDMGDEYPAKGTETTPERIAELASSDNKAGIKLIKEVKDCEPEAEPKEEPVEEEKPKAKPKAKKSGGKKKASK